MLRRSKKNVSNDALDRACKPVVELLEDRRMFSTTTIQTLPFVLDFSSDRGELTDKDGQGTGFTRVQNNRLDTAGTFSNSYQPNLIDLDTANGVLKLTTTGTSTTGSNYNNDNTQVNALETQFDATTSGFTINTRLDGPLTNINKASDQGGIYFGPDQDNYVKLVAEQSSSGQVLQFTDEQLNGSTYTHAVNQLVNIGSFSSITTLDLKLVGDAGSGTVNAFYSVNGAAFTKIAGTLTLGGAERTKFFNSVGRAGIIADNKNNLPGITVSFDSFEIDAGTPVAAQPAVTGSRPANGDADVARNAFVAADVFLPNVGAGIDDTTLNSSTVMLYRTSDHAPVAGVLNTSGGGDSIVLTPSSLLDANTSYTFEVTSGLKDLTGASFLPYTATFTTGTGGAAADPSIAFEKVPLTTAQGQTYTGVTMGPDGRLYASTVTGLIQRFDINPDGTLSAPFNITSLQTAEGGNPDRHRDGV